MVAKTTRGTSSWVAVIGLVWALGGCAPEESAGPSDFNPGPVATTGADYIFDLTVIRNYDVQMAPGDWQAIRADPEKEEYRPASLLFEGQVYEKVALRFKGGFGSLHSCLSGLSQSYWGRPCYKLPFKLKFN